MITALVSLLFASQSFAIPAPPRAASKTIRVLLGNHSLFTVSGYDLVIDHATRFPGSSVFSVRCGREEGSGANYVEYGAGRRAIDRLEITAPGGFVHMNDRPYREKLSIVSQGASCLVVNTLDLEKYIAGVIAREMGSGWPLEALKAQAVAARSYAMFQASASRSRDYDVESGTQDQVYEGPSAESPRVVLAAEATRGLTLAYGSTALKAYFHANCGGITEVPELVWGGEPHAFRPVVCPYHQKPRDRTRWTTLISPEQLERALRRVAGLLPRSFVRIASLEAGAPDRSRRLSDVTVSDGTGNNVLVSTNALRNALGAARLKSTAFQIHRDPAGFRIEGEGNGHGVGLCQVGARAMAELGKTYRQILQFYYPLAKISSLL